MDAVAQPPVRTARAAADLCEPHLRGSRRERLVVLHLDGERRLLRLVAEAAGGAGEVELPVRAIIADAVRYRSVGLILAHCHPSGDPEPSDADIAATRRLATLAGALGIALHDHLILAGGEWRSFRALGLL